MNLKSINLQKKRNRSGCLFCFCCQNSPFRAKFYTMVISYFDASVLLLPFIFERAGWLNSIVILTILHLWSYYMSIIVYECVHLIQGNYKMKQKGVDFEFLMHNFKHITVYQGLLKQQLNQSYQDLKGFTSSPWLSYTLSTEMSVFLTRNLFLCSLILLSSIGIVFSQYIIDNLFMWGNLGKTYGFQLIPETKILTEYYADIDHQPFGANFFSFSIGFGIIILLSLVLFLISFGCSKQSSRCQSIKFLIICLFSFSLCSFFLKPQLHISPKGKFHVDWDQLENKYQNLQMATPNIGLVFGILAFSSTLSQITSIPELLEVPKGIDK